ncbi:malonyl-ACP O-methyltransferase BioC [Paenibacillus psychroresistens]|nr:malonyl-ACP O-methyltransferase BioC [Paenibacillus psychroresistens]
MQTDPMMLNKKLVRQHFDRHAAEYDLYAVVQRKMANQLMKLIQQSAPQKQFQRILEIGCGTGLLTEMLQQQWGSALITAVDISPEMIKQTKLKLGEQVSKIRFIAADAEELVSTDLLHGDYDLIISNATFQWFQQPAETIKSLLAKMQSPNGLFAFSTFGSRTFYELHDSFRAAESLLNLKPTSHGQAFHTEEFWSSLFSNISLSSSTFNWQQEEQTVFHPNVRDFLTSIKRVGAGNATQSSGQALQLRQLFKQMEAYYSQHYSSINGIKATYDLAFGLFINEL